MPFDPEIPLVDTSVTVNTHTKINVEEYSLQHWL